MVEQLEHWTSNSEALSSSPTLNARWVPSSNPLPQLLLPVGIFNTIIFIEIVYFTIPEKPQGPKWERIIKVLLLLLIYCTCYCDF